MDLFLKSLFKVRARFRVTLPFFTDRFNFGCRGESGLLPRLSNKISVWGTFNASLFTMSKVKQLEKGFPPQKD